MADAKTGDRVRMHYTGRLTDGTEFDTSAGIDPLEFTLGAGEVIPGLDKGMIGMAIGEKRTISVACDEAYGPHRQEGVQEVSRSLIPADLDIAVGGRLQAMGQNGQPMAVTVVAITEEIVTVDANHPLAGEDLVFEVELVEIV